MDYQDCVDLIARLQAHKPEGAIRPGGNVPEVLAALGHPERALRGAMVVGTNGKGSTAAFAVSALTAAGVRVGSMPSPHLQEPRERIRVDGVPVSRAAYVAACEEVTAAADRAGVVLSSSGMHVTTAAAHFRRAGVDLVVAEAGIGGRNAVVRFLGLGVTVVTGVALDHTDRLGGSLELIARAKVGAVADGDHVLFGRLPAEAAEAADGALAGRSGLTVWRMGAEIDHHYHRRRSVAEESLVDVVTPGGARRGLVCPLPGGHQHHNLALGVAALDALVERGHAGRPDEAPLRERIAATRWPGRLELVAPASLPGWTGRVLLDGATNPQGVATVAPELRRLAGAARPAVVFAAVRGKDVPGMLAPLPADWPLVLTRTDAHDAAEPAALRAALGPLGPERWRPGAAVVPEAAAALRHAAGLVGPGGLVVVLGSHRLVGLVRTELGLAPG
ncbi:bifunctional folylpolyglutamate synthase/dihydrofolate synthase [Streptomyces hainanensis]|uniref:tetrahydrofolate synthase n=1 Tax=Streptomyces hainanensis TaxID=402648 RepID=A0A4R4SL68_9ACTN|nr:bifunctional folylpolyglutamate synthase/dihydrofolate synthase [Streptomyces hainanensis]TDC62822.1 bifunctional folylpolyglutamate synthase/dihydrofolate synthase [Streptomyces hainanensis]